MSEERFKKANKRIDETNAKDPNLTDVDGEQVPYELAYSRWLTDWVERLAPDASEPLLLAARSQHIERWTKPRASYPEGRAGYLKWRSDLKKFHAERSAEILREIGYHEAMIEAVKALNLKKNFPDDPESRVLEDALCLVFLERQFTDLANKYTEDKVVNALRKSWAKMSEQGRSEALKLTFSEQEKALIERALA